MKYSVGTQSSYLFPSKPIRTQIGCYILIVIVIFYIIKYYIQPYCYIKTKIHYRSGSAATPTKKSNTSTGASANDGTAKDAAVCIHITYI